MNFQAGDSCGRDARDTARLPQGPGPDPVQFFHRLAGQPRHPGIVHILGQDSLFLLFGMGRKFSLAVQIALVFDLNFRLFQCLGPEV